MVDGGKVVEDVVELWTLYKKNDLKGFEAAQDAKVLEKEHCLAEIVGLVVKLGHLDTCH